MPVKAEGGKGRKTSKAGNDNGKEKDEETDLEHDETMENCQVIIDIET